MCFHVDCYINIAWQTLAFLIPALVPPHHSPPHSQCHTVSPHPLPPGSGKTLAFLLPLVIHCRALRAAAPEEAGVKGVVVSVGNGRLFTVYITHSALRRAAPHRSAPLRSVAVE